MKIAIGFGAAGRSNDWERNIEFVQEAEKLGVEHVWTAETWGFDASTQAAFVCATSTGTRMLCNIECPHGHRVGMNSPAQRARGRT